jgi:hypothetical protein
MKLKIQAIMKTNTFLALVAAITAAIHSTNAQLIINGGFETPDTPTFMYIDAGQNTLAPWVVPGPNPVEVGDAIGNGFITAPAFEGVQMLDLHGRLTQTFVTIPGSVYTVTFAYTDHPVEPATQGLASAKVRLFDRSGNRLNQTFTHTGALSNDFHWTVFNGQFTALQSTTSLEFTPLTTVPGGLPGGILLDAVQVTLALRATLVLQGSGATLNWTGGVPPYRVQRATDLRAGDWVDVLTNAIPPVTLTLERPAEFYRIVGK